MNEADNYIIGMDIGTTNTKAMLMSQHGDIIASASRKNHLIVPGPNMAEENADEWWQNARDVFREISAKAGRDVIEHVRALSISSQTVTMLPVDRNGHPLRNALIWMDVRSSKEMHEISDKVTHSRFTEITGGQPDAGFLPNKILWFRRNEPELFAKTYKILQCSSYINFKLTGVYSMDVDQANRSQCMEVHTLNWSKEIGDAVGVDFDELLPKPSLTTEIIGQVTRSAAEETGLTEGIPVVAGCSDAAASVFATGLCRQGDAAESSGTSSLVFVASPVRGDLSLPVTTRPCAIPGVPYVFDAPISTSGAAVKWYLDAMGQEEKDYAKQMGIDPYTALNQVAEAVPAGSNGVLFFPYLMGERAPLWNSHAKGMFIGMSLSTEHADFTRAMFEGTAFALRHVMTEISHAGGHAKSLRITGGGAKSREWSRIKASMLRMPVYVLDDKSGDVPFGDILIAGHAVGLFPDIPAAVDEILKVKEIIEPNEQWADIYDQVYPYYISLYKDLDEDLRCYKDTVNALNLHR